jgi:hypothetical protein
MKFNRGSIVDIETLFNANKREHQEFLDKWFNDGIKDVIIYIHIVLFLMNNLRTRRGLKAHGGLQAYVRTRRSGLTTHGGGLQADDVRTRQSGLTTHGRQDVRTRQSGLTTSQKPPDSRPGAHALVVLRPLIGLSSSSFIRSLSCPRHSSARNDSLKILRPLGRVRTAWSPWESRGRRTPGRRRAHTPECRGVSRVHKPFIRRSLRACL